MDLKSQILELAFTPGHPSLIVACLDWQIHSIWIPSSKSRVLVPRRIGVDRGLEAVLLAPMPPPSPRSPHSILFFSKYGGEVLRACYSGEQPSLKSPKDSGSNWGSKLKLDVSKPILGLTCHPSPEAGGMVILLHADGVLRGYSAPDVASGGALEGQILSCLYSLQRECESVNNPESVNIHPVALDDLRYPLNSPSVLSPAMSQSRTPCKGSSFPPLVPSKQSLTLSP